MTIPSKCSRLFLDAYVVCGFILATNAFLTLLVDTNDPNWASKGSPLTRLAWGAIYLISTLRLIPNLRQLGSLLASNKAWIFLMLWTALSLQWSIDKAGTLRSLELLILSCLFALDISVHYSIRNQLRLLCYALAIIIVLSVVAQIFFTGLVPGQEEFEGNAWHGVYGSKNIFGRVVCLAVTAYLGMMGTSRVRTAVVLTVGLALGLLSQSAGAVGYILLSGAAFALWPILKWKRLPKTIATAAIVAAIALGVFYTASHFEQVTGMMGKDPHLSGRADIWRFAIVDIGKNPVFGYGFHAFWGPDSSWARRIREATHWEAPHSHNGYIDLTLDLGIVGLASYLILLFVFYKRASSFFMDGNETYRRWPLCYLAVVLVYPFTESGIVSGNNIWWILFCTLAFSLTGAESRYRVNRQLPQPIAATL